MVSVVLKKGGQLAAPPQISAPGCLDEAEDKAIFALIREEIESMTAKSKKGKGKGIEESIRNMLRKIFREELGKKPVLDIHIYYV